MGCTTVTKVKLPVVTVSLLVAACVVGVSLTTAAVVHGRPGSQAADTSAAAPSSAPSGEITDPAAFDAEKQRLEQQMLSPRPGGAPKGDPTDGLAQAKKLDYPESLDTGLFEDREAPMSTSFFRGTNRWLGVVGGTVVEVYAGTAGEGPDTGRLIVVINGAGLDDVHGMTFNVPGEGALRIISATGTTLTIVSAAGKQHTFDLISLQLS
jgi:hypothetical protein